MQEAIEAQLIGWMKSISDSTAGLPDDVREIKEHLGRLNGSVARHEKGLTEAVAWQRAHNADHVGTREEHIASADRRVEIVKAIAQFSPIVVALVALFVSFRADAATVGAAEPVALIARVDTPTATAYPTFTPTIPADFAPAPVFKTPAPEFRGNIEWTPEPIATPSAETATARERDYLARLCVVEVRDFGDERADACLSVISTVMTRTERRILSDGTIRGTITWNCQPSSPICQFPAYVVNGCKGIKPSVCPFTYPDSIAFFRGVVNSYFDRGERGTCSEYLFYGFKSFDTPECVIKTASFYHHWHGKARP